MCRIQTIVPRSSHDFLEVGKTSDIDVAEDHLRSLVPELKLIIHEPGNVLMSEVRDSVQMFCLRNRSLSVKWDVNETFSASIEIRQQGSAVVR